VQQGERDLPREVNRTQGGQLKGQQPLGSGIIEVVECRQDLVEVTVRPGFGDRRPPFQLLQIQLRDLADAVPGVHGRPHEPEALEIRGTVTPGPAGCPKRSDDPVSALPRAQYLRRKPRQACRRAQGVGQMQRVAFRLCHAQILYV
jgi:hypothetical protein